MQKQLEQMGYQAESAPWRNFYLCGALELREGLPEGSNYAASAGMARGMPLANLFQLMAVRLLPDAADGLNLAININLTDIKEDWLLSIANSVLNAFPNRQHEQPSAAMRLSSLDFKLLMMGLTDASTLIGESKLEVDGDLSALVTLGGLFDSFPRRFPIVTPRPA